MTTNVNGNATKCNGVSPKKLRGNLAIRSFRPEDHDACETLEIKANQFKNPDSRIQRLPIVGPLFRRLQDSIQVFPSHPHGFDAMAKTADEHEIIVCEDKSFDPPTVIAAVVVNIRAVFWSGTAIKVGWVHGLRVDEAYQRRGIGLALSNEVERRCRERGVSMLHLTVNLENTKAIALYGRLGYKHASHRAPAAKFLTKEERVPKDLLVVRMAPEMAALLTAKKYERMDMSPAAPSTKDGLLKLLMSSNCEGTFVGVKRSELSSNLVKLVADGDKKKLSTAVEEAIRSGEVRSFGGVSVINGSTFKRFKVVRFVFLKKDTWLSLPFQASVLVSLIVSIGYWWWKLIGRMIQAAASWHGQNVGFWSLAYLVVETFALAVLSWIAHKGVNFGRFMLSRDSSRLIARAFAPFSIGPMGIDCLRGALVASQKYSRDRGYGLWIMNVAAEHPESAAFPKPLLLIVQGVVPDVTVLGDLMRASSELELLCLKSAQEYTLPFGDVATSHDAFPLSQ